MNRQQTSTALSLLLHGILLVSIYAVSSSCAQSDSPLVIDFSVNGDAGRGIGEGKPPPGPPAPTSAGRPHSTPAPPRTVARSEPLKVPLPVTEPVVKTAVEQSGPAAVAASPKTESLVAANYEPSGVSDAAARPAAVSGQGRSGAAGGGGEGVSGASSGGGGTSPGPAGGGGNSADQLRNRYLKEHFAYIKDLIQRSISYPSRARKMGWTGRVVVSFVIHENGRVSNETVVASSGFSLLDNNVIASIRSVAPFPRPPVKAELRVPIIYRLD
ncbi:MAG: energy transducer TonB [Desulfuromonadales bacterium]|nr:energy transducer TonB [Desulfuromonadales bacterium]